MRVHSLLAANASRHTRIGRSVPPGWWITFGPVKLLLAPKWLRRLVTVPAMLVVFVWLLGLLPLWLLVAAFVSRFVPGRWRVFRLTWFATIYLALEVVTLTALFCLWVSAGFGTSLGSERSISRHHRLLAWFLRRLMATATFTFGLTFVRDGDARDDGQVADPSRPLLVFSRHAGAGDSFLLVDAVANGSARRRPIIVLKDVLQLDPAIDVMLNRIGAGFVRSGDGARDGFIDELARLAGTAGPTDAVVLFPEGGNFTQARRARAIDQLGGIGRPDLAARAERLTHLLPPKPLGVNTVIDAAPDADIVFVGHTGLESLSTARDLWRNFPIDHTVTTRIWRVRHDEIPPEADREQWLYDQWQEIDDWVGSTMAAEEAVRAAAAAAATGRPITLRQRLRSTGSFGSALGALVFWWASLTPSMLPRSPLIQAAVGAICAAIGFGLGGALYRASRRVMSLKRWAVPSRVREGATTALLVLGTLALLIGPWRWLRWQREHRRLVTMPPLSAWSIVPMMLLTVVVLLLLLTIARMVTHVVYRFDRAVATRIRVSWSRWLVVAAVIGLLSWSSGVAVTAFTNWADQEFGAFDTTTADGVVVPTSNLISGGPESLVDFDDLGYQGRTFVGRAPTPAELSEFTGDDAVMQPIRVYVGLDSAGSTEERVALAVDELRRTGAFDREVLVVATPTGTGWINPNAARTLEYMHRGDTAIVGVQYSFLPSWVGNLIDTGSPPELGVALFEGVHAAWSELPADARPKLIVFGESLGSFGGEEAFIDRDGDDSAAASLASLVSRTDGALFVGPTRSNPVWGPVVDGRDPGSRPWRPVWASQPNLRVATTSAEIGADPDAWPTPRVLYLNHSSDAVGTWEPDNLWSNPGWADDPAPPDIPSAARWRPIVSFAQESFDLMNGFSAAPGFGHDYRNHLTSAWAAVAPADGWTDADTARLDEHLGL